MRAKAFFQSVRNAEGELKMIRAQIRHYQEIGYSITGGSVDSPVVSHSRGSSRVETAAIGIFDKTRELEQQEREYVALITQAEQIVRQIRQERFRQVLTLHYLARWSMSSISDELKYQDPKSVYRARKYALHEAQKILDKKEAAHS